MKTRAKYLPNLSSIQRLFFALLFALLFVSQVGKALCASPAAPARQIVVLYDERADLPGMALLDAAFTHALASRVSGRADIYREAMDLSRFDSETYRKHLREHLRAKYAAKKIDVVVAVMEPALAFLLSVRNEVFSGTPMVFCGIGRGQLGDRALPPDVTGVLLKREFAPTLEIAVRLHPDTQRIAVVGGTSEFDARLLAQVREEFRSFENRFTFAYLTNLPLGEVLSQLSQSPPKTLVLYTSMFRDGAGESFVPHDVAERISQAANVPTYGFSDQYLGRGIVGGRLYGFGPHGEAAAGMVARILSGAKPSDLPLIEPANGVTAFDWNQLQRWKINRSQLPPNSEVRFRAPRFWEQYKWQSIGTLLVILGQAAIVAVLIRTLLRSRRAEGALRASELKYRNVVEITGTGLVIVDLHGRILDANQEYVRMSGHRELREIIGRSVIEWTAEKAKERNAKAVAQTAKDGLIRNFVTEYVDARGNVTFIEVNAKVEGEGESARIVALCRDVTERRRMEEALQESEERFRTVAKSAPVLIWMTGPDKLCTFVNKGWLDFTGRSLEQELGIGWAEGVHPEDAAHCLEICASSYTTRQEFRMEFRLRKGDGTYGWLLDTGVPRFGNDGTFLGFIGSCVDITERREAEAELRASQERMTMAAEAAQLGFWTWDIPRNIVWVSDKIREVFGFSAAEVLTRESFSLRVHPDDRAGANQAVERALAECSRYHIEYRIVRPDGAMRWITSTGRVKADSTGAPVLILGVAMDITERHRVEQESREVSGKLITAQEDERKRIARDLHDDLNQRLAMLSVEMEIFGSDYQGAGARELLETMSSQVRELSSEVHRLSYQLHPAKLDHLGLVAAARTFCDEVAVQSGIAVRFQQEEVPRDVNADVALCLYRVIQEALQNCLRHSKARTVHVMLHCDGEQIQLAVADDGKGFDVEHALHNGGLGLVSMRERVRQVHGSIQFISSPGRGTRIEVTVPLLCSSERVGSSLNPSPASFS